MQPLAWVNADLAPIALIFLLTTSLYPLLRAWIAARGTALRPVLVWSFIAVGLAIVAQGFAWSEPLDSGRPWMGRLTYLSTLASLAALLSVLNARNPGAGAWALLMAMLIVVFMIPWLEEPGRFRQAQALRILRLDAPWTIFYILISGTVITNYLPTRYGFSAMLLGVGYSLEYLSLTRLGWASDARVAAWSGFSSCLSVAIWLTYARAKPPTTGDSLNRSWIWFRDHWGVVWGLRIAERFNRTAETARWPLRIGWFGTIKNQTDLSESPQTSATMVTTFRGLLRRFVKPERLEEICG